MSELTISMTGDAGPRAARKGPRTARTATLTLAAMGIALAAGCARKNDPIPPEGALEGKAPVLVAPGEVTNPIADLED